MQIRSLKVYCDIVQLRSFSKAAEENGVSQSSASQLVHQLEERLGVQLIDRSKRPFTLTPEGSKYYEGCTKLVRRYDDLEHEVRTLHEDVASRLSIASIYSVGLAHMSQFQREFQAQHPKANIRLDYLHPDDVYGAVESEQADLGIVSFPERSRRLGVIPWRDESLVLAVAPSHPLAELSSAPAEALAEHDMIAFQRGLKIRDTIDRELSRQRVETHIACEFDNIETIKLAVTIGDGYALLPEPTLAREAAAGTLIKIPLAGFEISRPLGILHRREESLSDTAERFIELLHSHAADLDDPSSVPAPAPASVPATGHATGGISGPASKRVVTA